MKSEVVIRMSQCKFCLKKILRDRKRAIKYYNANKKKSLEYSREYIKNLKEQNPEKYEKRRARLKLYHKNRYILGKRRSDPLKQEARYALRNAVARGSVIRPKNCSECGLERKLHGHHTDYTKPLKVKWLCIVCHGLAHRRIK